MNSKITVLLVDADDNFCHSLTMKLAGMSIRSERAYTIQHAKTLLNSQHFAICLTDFNLPDGHSIELVHYISKYHPQLPVAVLTTYGNINIAISILNAGAVDFIHKPINQTSLEQAFTKAFNYSHIFSNSPVAEIKLEDKMLLGQSQVIQQLKMTLHKISRSQAPVFITGESGTGKEVVAKLIHRLSARHKEPFIAINCGAIPNDLIESELFGHKKGSFTGAHQDKQGLISAAQGGSLFLDEIAELPLNMQVKLLRAVQEKKIRPIGSDQEIDVDFRIMSASHQDLKLLLQQGKFRQDLFFRIHVIDVVLPPLREREQDILLLAHHFSHKITQEWQIPAKTFTTQAEVFLLAQSYPGNVRELRNIIERAITLADGPTIDIRHLCTTSLHPSNAPINQCTTHIKNRPSLAISPRPPPSTYIPIEGLKTYLESIEKELLLNALNATHWNRTLAAQKLGMTFRSLRYRLKKFGLDCN